jgi:hypothetical protein
LSDRRFRSLAVAQFNSDHKERRMARLASILALALLALAHAAHAGVYWGSPNTEACPFTGDAAFTCDGLTDTCATRIFSNKITEPSNLNTSFLQIQRLSVPENTFYEVPHHFAAVLSLRRALVHFIRLLLTKSPYLVCSSFCLFQLRVSTFGL